MRSASAEEGWGFGWEERGGLRIDFSSRIWEAIVWFGCEGCGEGESESGGLQMR
jgi:hypothetical protein